MSINMDSSGGADYSDFEYEQFKYDLQAEPVDGGGNTLVQDGVEYEPLAAQGGLDVNEVAEIVYMETSVKMEIEDEGQTQQTASSIEARGLIGANLPEGSGTIDTNQGIANLRFGDAESPVREQAGTVANNFLELANDDRVFQMFQAQSGYPHDGETSPGSTAGNNPVVYEKKWRDLTGRGPVLDSSDSIGVSALLVGGQMFDRFGVQVNCHLVYDTAEVSDAGRAFSVPE